jgi:hypothetical protein
MWEAFFDNADEFSSTVSGTIISATKNSPHLNSDQTTTNRINVEDLERVVTYKLDRLIGGIKIKNDSFRVTHVVEDPASSNDLTFWVGRRLILVLNTYEEDKFYCHFFADYTPNLETYLRDELKKRSTP